MRLKKAILIIFFATIYSLLPLKVLAYDVDFFSANDILFYNPDDTGCGDTAVGGSSSGSSADFMVRAEKAVKIFTGKGLSLAAAAGIVGNLRAESGLEPAKIEGQYKSLAPDDYQPVSGTGFGIAQWTFPGRQGPLVEFAKSKNVKITDLDMQLEFLWKEVTSNTFMPMLEKLNSIKSETPYNGVDPVIAATIIFHGPNYKIEKDPTGKTVLDGLKRGFEGSADNADKIINTRGGFATGVYNEFKGKIPDGTGVSGVDTGTGSSTSGVGDCGGNGIVAGDVVKTALSFALDTPATNGMNSESDAKPEYVSAINQFNPGANVADCGIYVGTVMIASGVDVNYPKAGTAVQRDYVKRETTKYQIIENPTRDILQPGDILIVNNGSDHHTEIYTGGAEYPIADASQDQRVPSVRKESSLTYMLKLDGVFIARVIK